MPSGPTPRHRSTDQQGSWALTRQRRRDHQKEGCSRQRRLGPRAGRPRSWSPTGSRPCRLRDGDGGVAGAAHIGQVLEVGEWASRVHCASGRTSGWLSVPMAVDRGAPGPGGPVSGADPRGAPGRGASSWSDSGATGSRCSEFCPPPSRRLVRVFTRPSPDSSSRCFWPCSESVLRELCVPQVRRHAEPSPPVRRDLHDLLRDHAFLPRRRCPSRASRATRRRRLGGRHRGPRAGLSLQAHPVGSMVPSRQLGTTAKILGQGCRQEVDPSPASGTGSTETQQKVSPRAVEKALVKQILFVVSGDAIRCRLDD